MYNNAACAAEDTLSSSLGCPRVSGSGLLLTSAWSLDRNVLGRCEITLETSGIAISHPTGQTFKNPPQTHFI